MYSIRESIIFYLIKHYVWQKLCKFSLYAQNKKQLLMLFLRKVNFIQLDL